MIPLTDREEEVMLVLQNLLMNYKNGGLLEPTLFTILEYLDEEVEFDKDELTAVLRSLDKKDCVSAPEAFRPRHPDPMVIITPIGWRELDRLDRGVPDMWLKAVKQILSLLYEKESENWDSLKRESIYVKGSVLETEINVPDGIFDVIVSYLQENEYIISDDKGYAISEKGAIAHENQKYTGEIEAYE